MLTKPIPIRMSEALLSEIRTAARHMEMSDQDAMRFCMRIGLKILETSDFDTVTPVAETAISSGSVSVKELIRGAEKRPRSPRQP